METHFDNKWLSLLPASNISPWPSKSFLHPRLRLRLILIEVYIKLINASLITHPLCQANKWREDLRIQSKPKQNNRRASWDVRRKLPLAGPRRFLETCRIDVLRNRISLHRQLRSKNFRLWKDDQSLHSLKDQADRKPLHERSRTQIE